MRISKTHLLLKRGEWESLVICVDFVEHLR